MKKVDQDGQEVTTNVSYYNINGILGEPANVGERRGEGQGGRGYFLQDCRQGSIRPSREGEDESASLTSGAGPWRFSTFLPYLLFFLTRRQPCAPLCCCL